MKSTPEVLLVDDNPADIDLTSEALARSKRHLHISSVNDGTEAIAFLRKDDVGVPLQFNNFRD